MITDSVQKLVAAGQKMYDETLKVLLEPLYRGKLLALDVDTGKYAIGDDTLSAFERLVEKEPAATVYIVRVGDSAAVTLGMRNAQTVG